MDYEPPFLEKYKTLLQQNHLGDSNNERWCFETERLSCELPEIDLGRLNPEHPEREECIEEITEAARKWGFFQVVNHGIPQEVLDTMHFEEKKVFYEPFVNKCEAKTYRWGNSCATNLKQLSWSEAFHFSLTDISRIIHPDQITVRSSLEALLTRMGTLAESLAEILAYKVNMESRFFQENCLPNTSFIRLNRYPACPISSKVYGLLPHYDSSFLTIVHQDQVGGLQLIKDGKWVDVKPNPCALVVNVGDLFQALSNGVYKSIKHRVNAAEKVERFSMAFFYCPSEEALIQSNSKAAMYKKFTLKEYRQQNEKDVKQTGDKVGLSTFLL